MVLYQSECSLQKLPFIVFPIFYLSLLENNFYLINIFPLEKYGVLNPFHLFSDRLHFCGEENVAPLSKGNVLW